MTECLDIWNIILGCQVNKEKNTNIVQPYAQDLRFKKVH